MKAFWITLAVALAAVAHPQAFKEIKPKLRERTPILTFHDVIDKRVPDSLWFDCSVEELKQIIAWLESRHAAFISLDQLYDHLTKGSPLPPHAIAITFADNYLGFYQRALPILKQHHIPTAMFVHTGFVGSRVGRPKMAWRQLAEIQRSGLVTVASQTVTHPPDLKRLTNAQLDKEMVNSKAAIETQLHGAAKYIAYPNGKWDNRSIAAARRAGYLMGFSEDLHPAETATNILAIPRYVHTKYRQAWRDAYGR
jgi:peptidoglycan/xylan/chitin deacetylase (PgdA/CDA1 family)